MPRRLPRLQLASVLAIVLLTVMLGRGQVARAFGGHRWRRHRRRGHRAEGPGSRRLGRRRNDRSPHPADQDRRHRRSGALPVARSAEGDLRGLGPRLWSRGLDRRSRRRPGQQLALTRGSRRRAPSVAAESYPAQYWLSLLQVPPRERLPGHRAVGQRHFAQRPQPGRVDPQHRQHRRLHRLPPDGRQGDARDPRAARQVPDVDGGVGASRAVGTGRQRACSRGSRRSAASARWRCGPTGPIASRKASCRPRRRRARRVASATSSSRCGTGRIRRRICTTRSRPTSGIRR